MKLYRYSSGEVLKAPRDVPRPAITAFFMPPDNKGAYAKAIMATILLEYDEEDGMAIKTSTSFLDPNGADGFVTTELEHLRWIHAEKVPTGLKAYPTLMADKNPSKSEWFETTVPDDFVPGLEEKIAATLHIQKVGKQQSGSKALIFGVVAVVALAVYYLFIRN